MKRIAQFDRSPPDIGSTMTPMIDIVFLLLVFFVWTYSFQAIERMLPSRLSADWGSQRPSIPTPTPEDDFEQLVIRIGWDGMQARWRLNDAEVQSLEQLRDSLRTIHEIHAETRVVLDPDDAVPLGHVIQLLDLTRLIGFGKVSFAAQRR